MASLRWKATVGRFSSSECLSTIPVKRKHYVQITTSTTSWLLPSFLLCLLQCECCVFSLFFANISLHLGFQIGVEVVLYQKLSKTNTTDDEVGKQNSPRKPNTTCSCELVCVCACVCLTGATIVDSVWVLWVPTPGPVSQSERQKWRVVVTTDALFSTVSARCCPTHKKDHLPSQLTAMLMCHICLSSQMIFVIKLRLSGIFWIPGWWHCALLFQACGCFPWKMKLAETMVAVYWCVCGTIWRIEGVSLMFSMPQPEADPLHVKKNTRWSSNVSSVTWGRDFSPENVITTICSIVLH